MVNAAKLEPETVSAWEQYLRAADSRVKARRGGKKPFLWMDEDPVRAQRVRQGEVLVWRVGGDRPRAVRHRLIHDWIGAMFVPHAAVHDVLDVVWDYDRYQDFYKPEVVHSKLLSRTNKESTLTVLWMKKVPFVTAVIETECAAEYFPVDENRWYSVVSSTNVQEIQGFGEPGSRALPPGQGGGYLWRLHLISRFEERDGGVYMELETIALSRDVPASLRWVVDPFVARMSRETVASFLRQTREVAFRKTLG